MQESGDLDTDKFEFGTSIERKSRVEEDMQKLAREGLIHPGLFGDQAAREKRYLQHIWTIRQRAVQKLKGWGKEIEVDVRVKKTYISNVFICIVQYQTFVSLSTFQNIKVLLVLP